VNTCAHEGKAVPASYKIPAILINSSYCAVAKYACFRDNILNFENGQLWTLFLFQRKISS